MPDPEVLGALAFVALVILLRFAIVVGIRRARAARQRHAIRRRWDARPALTPLVIDTWHPCSRRCRYRGTERRIERTTGKATWVCLGHAREGDVWLWWKTEVAS